jgi:hypothetical protein
MKTTPALIAIWSALITNASLGGSASTDPARRPEVVRLRADLFSDSAERGTPAEKKSYRLQRFTHLRALINDETLHLLNKDLISPNELVNTLGPILQDAAWHSPANVIHKRLPGTDVVLLAYTILYGARGLPNSTGTIQAFRKIGESYETSTQVTEGLDDCLLRLDAMPSPWPDQVWLLAHGQRLIAMQYHEKIQALSFDGFVFKRLWGPEEMKAPSFKIDANSVRITYEQEMNRGPRLVQELFVTPSGILESVPTPEN